ncbi:MAG: homoserine O-succinyltransferase [Clostridiales Family XIII bacterium]|jgi:homoserine O-succinyltransferase|nr:homoserine O-succinyltransferase [Clostridiales Family XIII bacterium]
MPILVQKGLPAYDILKDENVFVMNEERAEAQDIRPLKIAIVNLMPTKEVTETQLVRMLANTPLQVNLRLLTMESHDSKNADALHMEKFYETFDDIVHEKWDGLIITGAPVETLPFESVDYWEELVALMEYSKTNVFSTLHLCWGSQAALYHHYGIGKVPLEQKMFGIFEHKVVDKKSPFIRGFDDIFYVPHSRHTDLPKDKILACPDLNLLAESDVSGVHMIESKNRRQVFLQGHAEYDWNTLKLEYLRDLKSGVDIEKPVNYFTDDDPDKDIVVRWSGHGNVFFSNWLNYIYQETPYDLDDLSKLEW